MRHWYLWRHTTRRGVLWILSCETVVAAWTISALVTAPMPDARQWTVFVLIAACITLHVTATLPSEERRRASRLRREYVDHTGVWTVTAALILPAPMATTLIAAISVQRWQLARKPPSRIIFTSTAIHASVLSTHYLVTSLPALGWLHGKGAVPRTSVPMVLLCVAALGAAFAAYFLVQSLIIGIARACLPPGSSARSDDPRWLVRLIGTWSDNKELTFTMLGGFCAAALGSILLGLPLLLVAVGAVAITRKIQESELRDRQRRHDAKTGLLNPLGWASAARQSLYSHYVSHPGEAAVLVVDIDHFKQINDTFGHPNGDLVIRAVAEAMRAETRAQDLVCRHGGEEFLLLLAHTSLTEAHDTAERIRDVIANLAITGQCPQGGGEITMTATVSIGLAPTRPATDTQLACLLDAMLAASEHDQTASTSGDDLLSELEQAADTALYAAKRGGRNRVEIAPTSVDSVEATATDPPKPLIPAQASSTPRPQDTAMTT